MPTGRAVALVAVPQAQRGVVVALTADSIQVSVGDRTLHVMGAPSLVLGTSVTLERPPSMSADAVLLHVAGEPPVAVRVAKETTPAILLARPAPPIAATLVTVSGEVAAVAVAVGPAIDSALPARPAFAAFLRGEPVTGVLDATAALTLDDAVLRLPLQSRELPASTLLTVRLLSPPRPIAADSSETVELPRLPVDATLASRLEPLVAAAVTANAAPTIPLALLGLPGAAAVIGLAVEPETRSDDGPAGDELAVLAFEVDYPELGRVRIVVRSSSGRIDLTLRSERTLKAAVRGEIGQLAEAAGATAGLRASIAFAIQSGGAG